MTSSSWYRRGVWYLRGRKEYTKSGYELAKKHFVEKDLEDVDCSAKEYMITGSNSGIGLATAVELARRGGVIHLVCRNATLMKEARSQIITSTGNDRVFQHQLDMSKPREVSRWAREFLKNHHRLDVLINNAGCMIHERTVDEDDLESNFAVNTLAVHIITLTLLPLLQKSNDGRVITVSSGGMLTVKLDPHDLNFQNMKPFDGTMAYSQTKRQQVVMTSHYAQKWDKVHFFSMHPGWADTPAVRTALPEFYETMKDNLRTPEQGADTIVWLAISEAAIKHPSGQFFQDRAVKPTHLPLAWTRSSLSDENLFMTKLDELMVKFSESDETIVEAVDSPSLKEEPENEGDNCVFTVCSQIKSKCEPSQEASGEGSNSRATPTPLLTISEGDDSLPFEGTPTHANTVDSEIPTLELNVSAAVHSREDNELLQDCDVISVDQSESNDRILNNNIDGDTTFLIEKKVTEDLSISNSLYNIDTQESKEKF